MTSCQDYSPERLAVLQRPALYAHRGTSLLRPENTAIAFDWALEHHADVLETDVRLSRDDRVMVFHDDRLDRTTNGSGPVRAITALALERLDAGYRFAQPDGHSWRGGGARMMTLDALFERYPTTRVNIDIKDRDPRAADCVGNAIAKAGREDSVTVGSFHTHVLSHFRAIAPSVATAASKGEVAALYFGRWFGGGLAAATRRAGAEPGAEPGADRGADRGVDPGADPSLGPAALPYRYLQIPARYGIFPLAAAPFIARARAQGVQIVYWTINNESTMRLLIGRKVDGIVTDRADVLGGLLANDLLA